MEQNPYPAQPVLEAKQQDRGSIKAADLYDYLLGGIGYTQLASREKETRWYIETYGYTAQELIPEKDVEEIVSDVFYGGEPARSEYVTEHLTALGF